MCCCGDGVVAGGGGDGTGTAAEATAVVLIENDMEEPSLEGGTLGLSIGFEGETHLRSVEKITEEDEDELVLDEATLAALSAAGLPFRATYNN